MALPGAVDGVDGKHATTYREPGSAVAGSRYGVMAGRNEAAIHDGTDSTPTGRTRGAEERFDG